MDECGGCGENEECYEGECYCADGYDFNALGQCFLPDEGETQELPNRNKFNTKQHFKVVLFVMIVRFSTAFCNIAAAYHTSSNLELLKSVR